jgi:angiopoietin-like 4
MLYCYNRWTLIQTHYSTDTDFNTSYSAYKAGFGEPEVTGIFNSWNAGNYWAGLDLIHQLTSQQSVVLYVSVVTKANPSYKQYVKYEGFSVGDESSGYQLTISRLGIATLHNPDFLSERNLTRFSTEDYDQDGNETVNHAETFKAGWWYRADDTSAWNPNTPRRVGEDATMKWNDIELIGSSFYLVSQID